MALLTLYENNLRGLHWKLQGAGFHTAHLRFGEYYEKLGEFMDEVAEIMITQGIAPIGMSNLMDILKQSEIDAFYIDMAGDYTEEVANIAAQKMFSQLYEQAVALAKNDDLPIDVQDVYTDQARYYRIENLYKMSRAITQQAALTPAAAEPEATQEETPEDVTEE